jgi:hypothetical protein
VTVAEIHRQQLVWLTIHILPTNRLSISDKQVHAAAGHLLSLIFLQIACHD